MTQPTPPDAQGTSTRPYLIRALHDWCTDNGFTPYLAVHVDQTVQVPLEYVKNHEIVLNVGFEATSSLKLGNEFVEFKARFGGVAREIVVPVDHVVAIYARENGQGMAFPMPTGTGVETEAAGQPVTGSTVSPIDRSAPRGLRLASTEQAAPDEPAASAGTGAPSSLQPVPEAGASDSDDTPPQPPRPTLKRIK